MDNVNFYFITVATQPHPVLDILLKTVESKGEQIEILGLNENRKVGQDLPNGSRRLGIKLKELYDFINRNYLNANDIVLFTDAYDVFYSGDKTTILNRFKEMNKPIVFGAEACCYPDGSKANLYPKTNSRFRYLNSGLFIGKIGAFRECMKNYIFDDDVNDQLWWTEIFLNNQHLIELDYTNQLFLNCVWMNEKDILISDDKVTYNNTTPQIIHGNGPSKYLIEPLLEYSRKKFMIL